jgi:hypothetical protein
MIFFGIVCPRLLKFESGVAPNPTLRPLARANKCPQHETRPAKTRDPAHHHRAASSSVDATQHWQHALFFPLCNALLEYAR